MKSAPERKAPGLLFADRRRALLWFFPVNEVFIRDVKNLGQQPYLQIVHCAVAIFNTLDHSAFGIHTKKLQLRHKLFLGELLRFSQLTNTGTDQVFASILCPEMTHFYITHLVIF